jgi:hypothetical protein
MMEQVKLTAKVKLSTRTESLAALQETIHVANACCDSDQHARMEDARRSGSSLCIS